MTEEKKAISVKEELEKIKAMEMEQFKKIKAKNEAKRKKLQAIIKKQREEALMSYALEMEKLYKANPDFIEIKKVLEICKKYFSNQL